MLLEFIKKFNKTRVFKKCYINQFLNECKFLLLIFKHFLLQFLTFLSFSPFLPTIKMFGIFVYIQHTDDLNVLWSTYVKTTNTLKDYN